MYTLISKFAIIPTKKQVVKIRKAEADTDSGGCETTHAQGCKYFNSACLLHVIHPQLLKRKTIFIYIFGLQK